MKEEIQKFFKGDVLDDEATLVAYSHDASLLEVRPQLVVFPKDSADVQALVKWVSENKKTEKNPNGIENLSLTARCAGTCMSGGSINESIIMDFTKYMHGVISVTKTKEGGESIVLPGTFYRDFEVETLKQGLILPCYTASKDLNAVGGMVGNNSAGEKTLRYGKTENYIKKLKVVFEDGKEYEVVSLTKNQLDTKMLQSDFEGQLYRKVYELIRRNKEEIDAAKPKVSKNSAGYYLWNVWQEEIFDLNKLIVGSQGTLGIVTEITFKLVPVKKTSKLVVVFLNDLTKLGNIVGDILKLNPESLESYDDKTFKLGVRFFKDFFKKKGLFGIIKFGLSFIPEILMVLRGGVPKLVLLVEFAGEDESEVERQCKQVPEILKQYNLKIRITESEQESEKYWDMRRDSFALLRKHMKGIRTAPFIDDIVVRPEFLPEFLPKLNEILSHYDLIYTIAGHAGNGNFHIIPLMDFNNPKTKDIILELSDKVYDLVLQYQGSITAEHNDGIIRTPYLEKMYGAKIYSLFKETKEIFDPQNMFNPNKKVGGSKEYLAAHIIHSEHIPTIHQV